MSVNEELIVSEVAVEDKVILVPAIKFEGPNGTYPRALVIFSEVKSTTLNGVYPKAEVTSDADNEKLAVKLAKPSLDKTKVLSAACGVEKEIDVT